MITLKEYQSRAVEDLLDKATTLLSGSGNQQKLIFKAPTGSGKTVVMGAWLRRMAQTLPDNAELPQRRFAYIWIAPNQLHQQSLLKLRSFFEETHELRCLEFDDLAETTLAENDLLFFNWQSISRDDAIVIRDGEQGRNLSNLVAATRENGVELVAILDEAHLFATKGDKALKVLNLIDAKLEIDVSATPAFVGAPLVEVLRQKVVKAEMIKKGVVLNPAVKDEGTGDALNAYLLKTALTKREELERRHAALGSPVRPLLLVQLPNDSAKMSPEDNALRETIEKFMESKGITKDNGKLAVWLSDSKDKVNLEGVERFDSVVEVLLFKQAIALGWDCPRAAVLMIFRDIKSMSFTIQTVGRILRMPEQRHYNDDLLNYGYVFTNIARDMITIVRDDMDYFSELRSVRQQSYCDIKVESSNINKRQVRNRLGSKFRTALEVAAKKSGWVSVHEDLDAVAKNKEMLAKTLWDIEPKRIDVKIPKDFRFDGDHEQAVSGGTTRYAKTTGELDSLFHQYCLNACHDYAKVDSRPVMQLALLEFFESYLDLDEFNAIRVMLAENNQLSMGKLIGEALSDYEDIMLQRAASVSRIPERYGWEVPELRFYDADQHVLKNDREHHVMQPAYAKRGESCPEAKFAEFLEANADSLVWWYKNGDHGKEHFAVPYKNASDEWALFYVDFLMRFKDGTLGFFDTKTVTGDAEAFHKHNALLDYLAHLRNTRTKDKFVGGIIIQEKNTWRYCLRKLALGFDTQGWTVFDPRNYMGES